MIQFFTQLLRLLSAIRFGFKTDPTFRVVFYLLNNILFVGTMFYWRIEEWSFIDSLYFSVMTLSTIGYGDLTPTTDFSKMFTVVFTLIGVAAFAAVGGKLVQIVLMKKAIARENRKQDQEKQGEHV